MSEGKNEVTWGWRSRELLATLNQLIAEPRLTSYSGRVYLGVDLGTAFIVVIALDGAKRPLAGAMRFAQVVREGVVLDFLGAVEIVKQLRVQVENCIGKELAYSAAAYPPRVPLSEVGAIRYTVEEAGLVVTNMVDEPTAANAVLGIEEGAVVDVGGGTTGIAVFRGGEAVYTADEPTGGTHLSLVIAGAKEISFEEAEELKRERDWQPRLFPLVQPVMQKIATIILDHVARFNVEALYLVGGTCCFEGFDQVIEEETGIPTHLPPHPLLVTPLGIAMNCKIPE